MLKVDETRRERVQSFIQAMLRLKSSKRSALFALEWCLSMAVDPLRRRPWIFPVLLLLPLRVYAEVNFDREVRPILSEHCFPCHGPDSEQRRAGLRLDTKEGLFGEIDGIIPIVPGEPKRSEVLARILHSDPDELMPPPEAHNPLSPKQIGVLQRWVAEGAVWQRHWAFEPILKPALPPMIDPSWIKNEIDLFIQERHQTHALVGAPQAERTELVRRLSLDLHGLPPDPALVDEFVSDVRPDAYERLLDRLFASPRYGERMVWDWLDAARYADSNGYQGDRERTMWPWRDWAAQALNRNIPFDEFTIQQLAGDLLPQATQEQILATGFSRNHMINGEGGRIPEENRIDYVMDMAETMGTVWLGLTVNCCRCHDHKFDPLSQRDYYGLFAFFNQTPVTGAGGDPQTAPVLEVPAEKDRARRAELVSLRKALERRISSAEADVWREVWQEKEDAELIKLLDASVSKRKDAEIDVLIQKGPQGSGEYKEALRSLKKTRQELNSVEQRIPKVMVMADRAEPRESFILNRGLYNQPGAKVTAATPTALPPMPSTEPRNRLGLARWLVSPSNPLTARVFVNRQWALFMGQGLVATPEDFGSQGERPSHPDLLDWLASRFIESGWDIKGLHRTIVESATYRQTSRIHGQKLEIDPENRLYARGPRYRLPSWMIRDQALAASGLLVDTIGGPPVKPYQPDGVWADFSFGNKRYKADSGQALYRRSLYTFWRRIIGPTMFFDAAKRQTCVVKSARTNTPLHALATMNDVTYVEASRALAERVMISESTSIDRLRLAFRITTGRSPEQDELDLLQASFERTLDAYRSSPEDAVAFLSQGQHPLNPKLDSPEHAAYAAVCSLILNLDETLSKQ